MRMVDPGQAVGVVRCGGKLWFDLPAVGVDASWRNRVIHLLFLRGSIRIERPCKQPASGIIRHSIAYVMLKLYSLELI